MLERPSVGSAQGRGISAVKAAATPVVCPRSSFDSSSCCCFMLTPCLPQLSITICNSALARIRHCRHQLYPILSASNAPKDINIEHITAHHINPRGYAIKPLSLQYGISGPYWYAGGATIQIIIFSILSIMLKTRAPGAKTFLQVRSQEEGDVRDFEWSNAAKHNMN